MQIALIVPSRERIDKKISLVNSIIATVDNIKNIVLYFGIDDDDPTKDEVLKIQEKCSFVKIVEIHNEGKFLGLGKLWNICVKEVKEEIYAMVGDDMMFRTKGWDTKILEEFSEANCPKDNIKMVYCNDARHGSAIAVNFFIHKAYVDITGYLCREEFLVDFIDLWPQQIFTSLGRIKYRGDIVVEHLHWSFRKSQKDTVSNNLRGNQYPEISQNMWKNTVNERIKEAQKIGDVIGVKPNLSKINGVIVG